MLGRRAETSAVHRADDERRNSLAAKHVAEFGGLVKDLVEAYAHEVHISSTTGRSPAVAAPIAAPTNADSLIGVNRQFKDWLKSKNVKFTEEEAPDVGHVWPLWRRNLAEFAQKAFQKQS